MPPSARCSLRCKEKGFIAHVDVPADVRRTFAQLQTVCGKETRANPAFATQKTE